MREMIGLAELRQQGRMTWMEPERGWVAAPEEILTALAKDGFAECKRELTTSRSDSRPAGGVWQGVDERTATVASAIWVNRPGWQQAIVFIDIDGQSFEAGGASSPTGDADRDEGGEG
jgi:hypothetical protein